MNEHDFFNFLEKRTQLHRVNNDGVFHYPAEYIARFEASAQKLSELAEIVREELENFTQLEKEQFKYTTKAKDK